MSDESHSGISTLLSTSTRCCCCCFSCSNLPQSSRRAWCLRSMSCTARPCQVVGHCLTQPPQPFQRLPPSAHLSTYLNRALRVDFICLSLQRNRRALLSQRVMRHRGVRTSTKAGAVASALLFAELYLCLNCRQLVFQLCHTGLASFKRIHVTSNSCIYPEAILL